MSAESVKAKLAVYLATLTERRSYLVEVANESKTEIEERLRKGKKVKALADKMRDELKKEGVKFNENNEPLPESDWELKEAAKQEEDPGKKKEPEKIIIQQSVSDDKTYFEGLSEDDPLRKMLAAINGDAYVSNDMGEAELGNPEYRVYIPYDLRDIDFKNMNAVHRSAIIVTNYLALKKVEMSNRQRYKCAVIRAICLQNGWMDYKAKPEDHNVAYNEAVLMKEGEVFGDVKAYTDARAEIVAESKAYEHTANLRKQVTNIVCLVAYIFRVRGHHYLPDYQQRYEELWAKNTNCAKGVVDKDDWRYLATVATHAIMPYRLDKVYTDAVSKGDVYSAMHIRVNAPAAGTAVWFVLSNGLRAIETITGGFASTIRSRIGEVHDYVEHLLINRWEGAINRRFYGARDATKSINKYIDLAGIAHGANDVDDEVKVSGVSKAQSLIKVANASPINRAIWRATARGVLSGSANREFQETIGKRMLDNIGFAGEMRAIK